MVTVTPKKKVLIVTKNETKTPKTTLKKISPYKKDNTYRYIKNAAIATTTVAATAAGAAGLYKLYQDAQKDKKDALNTASNALRLEDQAAINARLAEEARLEAERVQAELVKKEQEAAHEAEAKRMADEAEAERLQKEQQIIEEAQALEAERIRLEGIAEIEKAKETQRLADEKEKQRLADEKATEEIRRLADEKAAQIKLQADAAEKRLQEAIDIRKTIERAAAEKIAADKIQAAKQREQYLEAKKLAEAKKVADEEARAAARSTELNNLYAEFAKLPGFVVPDSEFENIYENFIKFSQHREKNCYVENGKCPDCTAASQFQMCLTRQLNSNNVDFNKIIKIMREFHYNVSELGVGINGLQFRKDLSTRNLHLNYPVKENAKIRY